MRWIIGEERINEYVEDKMIGNGMKHRAFSFGEGIRGMRPGGARWVKIRKYKSVPIAIGATEVK